MAEHKASCVLLADGPSLLESARRLQPEVAVVDNSLTRDANLRWKPAPTASC